MIQHVCHPSEPRHLGQVELADRYGIHCNFLEALRICSSVPHSWRAQLTHSYVGDVAIKYEMEIGDPQHKPQGLVQCLGFHQE